MCHYYRGPHLIRCSLHSKIISHPCLHSFLPPFTPSFSNVLYVTYTITSALPVISLHYSTISTSQDIEIVPVSICTRGCWKYHPSFPPSLTMLYTLTSRAHVRRCVEAHSRISRPGSYRLQLSRCQSHSVHPRAKEGTGPQVRVISTVLHTLSVT